MYVHSVSYFYSSIIEENTKYAKMVDDLQNQLAKRVQELYEADIVCDKLKKRIEMQSRKNFEDRNTEFLRELQSTKDDAKDLLVKNEQVTKNYAKLNTRVTHLLNKLNEYAAELKNERRRHSLLTTEFNSLLKENSTLKKLSRQSLSDKNLGSAINMVDNFNEFTYLPTEGSHAEFHTATPNITHNIFKKLNTNSPNHQTNASIATTRKLQKSSSHESLKTNPLNKQCSVKRIKKTKSSRDLSSSQINVISV